MVALLCGLGMIGVMYIGVVAPETSVYTQNQIPAKYLSVATEVGAIQKGEKVHFFYSDAMLDVRESFYLVTDSKVSIYVKEGAPPPLQVISFDEIASAELSRDESFVYDSQIMLELKNGDYVSFPVSSEYDRDEAFFRKIEKSIQ